MNFIERVMRAMTHINIGAALGLVAWVLWSGWQVVTGQIAPGYRVAEVKAMMTLPHAHASMPMRLVPVQSAQGPVPACHGADVTAPVGAEQAKPWSGADL